MPRAATADNAPILTIRLRADLRVWLAANHTQPGPIWRAITKQHHPDHPGPCEPITDEPLCRG